MGINIILQNKIYKEYKNVIKFNLLNYNKKIEILNYEFIKLLNYVYQNNIFYNNLYKNIDIKKIDLLSIEKLPVVTKKMIKENKNIILSRSIKKSDKKTFTGGSTGEPLIYYYTKESYNNIRGVFFWLWYLCGWKPGDKVAYIDNVGKKGFKGMLLNKLKHQITENMYNINTKNCYHIYGNLKKFNPLWIRTLPSAIYSLSTLLEENKVEIYLPKLKGIFCTGEMLYDFQKEKIEKVFHVPVFSQYGAGDGGIMATNTEENKNNFTLDMSRNYSYSNIENNIITTDIKNDLFPFINYKVGDIGNIIKEKEQKYITNLKGRTTENLIFENGKIIHGLFFVHLLDEYMNEIDRFQIVQKSKKNIVFILKFKSKINKDKFENIVRDKIFKKTIEKDLCIEFNYECNFIKTNNHKTKIIITEDDYNKLCGV